MNQHARLSKHTLLRKISDYFPVLPPPEISLGDRSAFLDGERIAIKEQISGVPWDEVPDALIEPSYASIFLLPDTAFGYYLPSILSYALRCNNVEVLRELAMRLRGTRPFNRSAIQSMLRLTVDQLRLLVEVFCWGLNDYMELSWKEVMRIEQLIQKLREE